ncbi:hypothetical protein [Segniliparus rugosus]|uniref:Uncharacterized protein n=1 Tax=Segniliparus rugosus (strain ATCC BAA-974 / DSM 45345 / CCUG 50838 / CIP 108380 / JCM 13579 / CDC 945) TaxID=679197 RepID=U1M2T7_SEGRC|nr:hypothetical protein [Segniliparus rugosus]ERG69420.1 hypothetical protein HMPREF9336_04116 [Segniliparus rugosus ATCC BAA-974]
MSPRRLATKIIASAVLAAVAVSGLAPVALAENNGNNQHAGQSAPAR